MSISGTTTTRLAAALATVTLTLTGCSGGSEDAAPASSTSDGPRVLQGGEPGEKAQEVPEAEAEAAPEWTHSDVMFMQMMIPHHAQALEMADLAKTRAGDARVRSLAERIRAAQGPEITMMAAWLDERQLEVPRADEDPATFDHAEHGHAGMSGMMTAAQMKALAAAKGAAFDRLFLAGMIRHHEGALQMADETALDAGDVRVGELRDDVSASQSAEIARMQGLLSEL